MSSAGRSGHAGSVESFYGDLIDEVALAAPVTRSRLVAGLAAVEREVEPGPGASAAGDASVITLSVADWNRVADRAGLRPGVSLAVREVHRRMAGALGETSACATPGADPCVIIDA